MTIRKLALLGFLSCAASSQAGELHPALMEEMDRAGDGAPFSVLVHMEAQAPVADLDSSLRLDRATRRERHEAVLTSLQSMTGTQDAIRREFDARIASGGVFGYTSYWISNLLVVFATPPEIRAIASRPDVAWVEPNFRASLIDPVATGRPDGAGRSGGGFVPPGLRAIRVPEVWNDLGYTGTYRIVANLDTGVDGNHPALATRWRGYAGAHPWQECWLDVVSGSQFPADLQSHGTHVMGTLAGLGAATGDSIGVALGAEWIACNAIGQSTGPEFDNDILTALQWFSDPDGQPGTVDDVPDVVENSWGVRSEGAGNYLDCDARWWTAIDNLEAAGVVTVWAAGNEGPDPETIRSPADRAASLTNTFSVGAVDATDFEWPYPIADFSSHGPTECVVAPEHELKPEVVAPGVDIYSSIPGGAYADGWQGTSMAGPHVAGIVALLREANPDLDVHQIKEILMQTARDLGGPSEDNEFGWGFVDAYEAVLLATSGFGYLEGIVRNASYNDTPIPGARIELIESGYVFSSDSTGYYTGFIAPSTFTAVASAGGYADDTTLVVIESGGLTVQDFGLEDTAGPVISDVTKIVTTLDTAGPYPIQATIEDNSAVDEASLFYRLDENPWIEIPMAYDAGAYAAGIPGQSTHTRIEFYVRAQDVPGLVTTSPPNAPSTAHTFYVTELFYAYQAEDPPDTTWRIGNPGVDDATGGLWIRDDPVGTTDGGQQIQPEDDATPDPGVKCFVTGNGEVGGYVGDNDVDDGCTSLRSPQFDLSAQSVAFVTYSRWFGAGANNDDTFFTDVSSNGGWQWIPLERVSQVDNTWRRITLKINNFVPLTDKMEFRFKACDLNQQGFTEAAMDDFGIEIYNPGASGAPDLPVVLDDPVLRQNAPNPARPLTTIQFRLSNPGDALLRIYDGAGRRVRTLHEGILASGFHTMRWDGNDDLGRPAASGVYFYKLKAGPFEQSRRMILLR